MRGEPISGLAGVDHQDVAPGPGRLDGGGQAGKAAAHDGKIILHGWILR